MLGGLNLTQMLGRFVVYLNSLISYLLKTCFTWNVNLGEEELMWLYDGEWQPLLFLKSLISLHDPGNLLTTEGELGEFDKEYTAIFCDDNDEYLLAGPLDSIVCSLVAVKSPTEEEHLLDITKEEFPLRFERIPLGTHFTLLFDWFTSSFFLGNSSNFMGDNPVNWKVVVIFRMIWNTKIGRKRATIQ